MTGALSSSRATKSSCTPAIPPAPTPPADSHRARGGRHRRPCRRRGARNVAERSTPRALRRRHPQRRHLLRGGAAVGDGGRAAARLRRQRARALCPDGADRAAGSARLSQLRHAPRRARRPRRPRLDGAPGAGAAYAESKFSTCCSLSPSRAAGRRAGERARARLGGDPHGRRERARRPRPGASHAAGSPSATIRRRASPANISTTCASARPTRRRRP